MKAINNMHSSHPTPGETSWVQLRNANKQKTACDLMNDAAHPNITFAVNWVLY